MYLLNLFYQTKWTAFCLWNDGRYMRVIQNFICQGYMCLKWWFFFLQLVPLDLSWNIGNMQLTELTFQEKKCDYWKWIVILEITSVVFILEIVGEAVHWGFYKKIYRLSTCSLRAFGWRQYWYRQKVGKYNLIRLLINAPAKYLK